MGVYPTFSQKRPYFFACLIPLPGHISEPYRTMLEFFAFLLATGAKQTQA